MSGFVAIIANLPGCSVPQADVQALADEYDSIRGGVGETVAIADRVGAVAYTANGARPPSVERRGGAWVLAAGALHHHGLLLDCSLDHLEGQFALLRYAPATNTATLVSDPFGMFGLYVAQRDGCTYVATSAIVLARHLGARPSPIGLQTFLLAGYQCGARTGWEGIERMEGGIQITFGNDEPRRDRYWRPAVDHALQRQGIAASVDHCLETAVQAVRNAGAGHDLLWCDLTGGYDTRFLALLARTAGLNFITATNGDGEEEDVRLARLIAESEGWDWSLLSLPPDWEQVVCSRLPEAIGWGDAALEAQQLAGVLWRHEVKARRARALLNGGGGEHYWSYAWQHEYGRSARLGTTNLGTWVHSRMLQAIPTQVFAGDPRREVVSDLRARMETVIEPYLGEVRAVQADALYLHKCTGHFGAYASAGCAEIDVLLPFYTRGSFVAAFSTDPRHRLGHRFYRRLIDRLDPRVAALPTAKGGPAQPPRTRNLVKFVPYYTRLAEKGFNKASQRLLGRSSRTPSGLDERSARLRATVVAAVGRETDAWYSHSLYDPEELRGLLSAASRPDFADSVLLGRMLTVELGLRAAGVPLAHSL